MPIPPTQSTPSRSIRTARSPTSVAGHTAPAPSASRRSSSPASRAPTGAAMPTARCSRACMGPRGRRRSSSRNTSGASRRLWRASNVNRGYTEVRTPILYDVELWKQSGHWHVYRDHMYFTDVEAKPMGLKPMNCPAHVQIFKRDLHSYRDLPIRYAEQGLVHRHEPSGTLHGLLRVRHITQDDAHVFCREDQIEEEVVRCLDFGFFIYDQFGFKPRLELSTRPEKRVGTEEMWDKAEAALKKALADQGLEYDLNEGDGAFYGPKIDLHMTDTIGRSWQLGTVQLDYYMPEQFE